MEIKVKGAILAFKHTPQVLPLSRLVGAKFDNSSNSIQSADSNYIVSYVEVREGLAYQVSASNSQAKNFFVGFTLNLPSVGETVTNIEGGVVDSYSKTLIAPYDGYFVAYSWFENFTNLSVVR